jgi:hypothetical protein
VGLWAGLAGGLPAPVASLILKIAVTLLAVTIVNRVRKGLHETNTPVTENSTNLVTEYEHAAI